MKPVLTDKKEILLAGYSFYGDPFNTGASWTEENEIGRLWSRFMAYFMKHRTEIESLMSGKEWYELHLLHEDTAERGEYEVFIGFRVESCDTLPLPFVLKRLPATRYAVYTVKGDEIMSDKAETMHREWLQEHDFETAHPYSFQFYDERFKGMDKIRESVLDVYFPILEKS